MAYPSVSAPYGFIPVNAGGRPYSGHIRQIPILTEYAAAIFNGDLVKIHTDGTVNKDTGTTTATPIGIFLGCSFTDADRGYVHSNYWPAAQTATDAMAYVADDPDLFFKVALVSGTTVMAGGTRAELIGGNTTLVQNTGSTTTGRSAVAVVNSTATTETLPIRIVDGVEETMDGTDYMEVIVRFNGANAAGTTGHAYDASLGTNST